MICDKDFSSACRQKSEENSWRQMMMKMSEHWITENFEALVAQYGGKYIGVVGEEVIAVALTPREVLKHARKLGKEEEEVSLLKVPTQEELVCVL
jgi:hypothetical protein